MVAEGVPPGLGEPIFDRLDADIAHALMSINAVKGVEIGAGFACVVPEGERSTGIEMTPGRLSAATRPAVCSAGSPAGRTSLRASL